MARMPGAIWRPVVNVHKNGTKEHRGLVLHVQAGDNSPFGWFDRTESQASSDFWVSKTGTIEQYVDTGVDYAWAQAAGNAYYASVETEGEPSEALTGAQVEGVAKIYAWGHKTFGWSLVVVDSITEHGLTWHGMGGAAWGGHTGCPGDLRKEQRGAIMVRAKELASDKPAYKPFPGASFFMKGNRPALGKRSPIFTAMGKRLIAVGCGRYKVGPGPELGQADVDSYEAFQRSLGYTGAAAKWPPGPASWAKLHVPNV